MNSKQPARESLGNISTNPSAGEWGTSDQAFALAGRLNRVSIETVKLLSVTQLKAQAGKILDRALTGKPQYVVRDGEVLQITKAGLVAGVEDRPPGYFADDYANAPDGRLALERAMGKVRQRPER